MPLRLTARKMTKRRKKRTTTRSGESGEDLPRAALNPGGRLSLTTP